MSAHIARLKKRGPQLAARDGGWYCHWCKRPVRQLDHAAYTRGRVPPDAATIDHVVPASDGGTNEMGNLVLACHECNYRRGQDHARNVQRGMPQVGAMRKHLERVKQRKAGGQYDRRERD